MTDSPQSDNVNLGFIVEVVEGDALTLKADVLAVKYAPRSGGLGAQVRKYLKDDIDMLPGMGEYRLLPGGAATKTEYVLMVGTVPIFNLRYPQLRDLGRAFIESLWLANLDVRHLMTTSHGVRTGAGLDEVEALRALLLGMADAYEAGHYPPNLKRVTFVEKDPNRVRVMQGALDRFLPDLPDSAATRDPRTATSTMGMLAGAESFEPEYRGPEADETTPHVFVAMPFREEFDDQYYLAIQPALHELGLLSERMDLDAFTGDIKARMLERIRTARFVIALLDDGNPNVYLEVGYAWGVETPTILAAHSEEALPFDVRGERVLIYDRIYRLKEMLNAELVRLLNE